LLLLHGAGLVLREAAMVFAAMCGISGCRTTKMSSLRAAVVVERAAICKNQTRHTSAATVSLPCRGENNCGGDCFPQLPQGLWDAIVKVRWIRLTGIAYHAFDRKCGTSARTFVSTF
jgi:hypothetical protein